MTRAQVAAQVADDREFCRRCLQIMVSRHARRASGETGITGWGSSDASRIQGPASKVLDGSADEGDWDTVMRILPRYARPVARHLREEQLSSRPDLDRVARLYGVGSKEQASKSPSDVLEVAILSFLVEHGNARTGEIVAAVEGDREAISDRLRDMMLRGTLHRTGHGAGTTYALAESTGRTE